MLLPRAPGGDDPARLLRRRLPPLRLRLLRLLAAQQHHAVPAASQLPAHPQLCRLCCSHLLRTAGSSQRLVTPTRTRPRPGLMSPRCGTGGTTRAAAGSRGRSTALSTSSRCCGRTARCCGEAALLLSEYRMLWENSLLCAGAGCLLRLRCAATCCSAAFCGRQALRCAVPGRPSAAVPYELRC